MTYLISDVNALYPRIDKPYRFDNAENRSVPCDPLDEGAVYEMSFEMTKDQAKELFKVMAESYQEKREDKWPDKLEMPFTKNDAGMYVGKAKLKAAYGKETTNKPAQFDAKTNKLPEDFRLTTNSTVNLAVIFVPYNMRDHGVSLRLKAVQVVKLAEQRDAVNPFDKVDGFDAKDDNPFVEATPVEEPALEEEPAPKKVASKKTKPKPKDEDLSSLIDDWDDQ